MRRALPPRRGHRRGALVGVARRSHRRRPPTHRRPRWTAFLERVHPEDRAAVRAAVTATAPDGTRSQRDLRVVWPDGSAHWYDARWRLVADEPAGPAVVGIARLIDAERAALERMRFLADVSAALDARWTWSARWPPSPSCGCATSPTGARSTWPASEAGCATSRSRMSTPPRSSSRTADARAYPPDPREAGGRPTWSAPASRSCSPSQRRAGGRGGERQPSTSSCCARSTSRRR